MARPLASLWLNNETNAIKKPLRLGGFFCVDSRTDDTAPTVVGHKVLLTNDVMCLAILAI